MTPEIAPLALFGPAISEEIDRLLRGAGIRFRGSSFTSVDHGALTLQPRGTVLRPQRIVALPLLEGVAIAGLPTDPHGFVPVDRYGERHSQILDPELTTEESGCTRGAAPGSRLPETSGCGA